MPSMDAISRSQSGISLFGEGLFVKRLLVMPKKLVKDDFLDSYSDSSDFVDLLFRKKIP
jgi:hypothetical protein